MEKKYIKIETTGKVAELVVTEESEYSDLSGAVQGVLEMVPSIFEDHYLYLNEEGKLIGLEINELATSLANGLSSYDIIVGDVVIVGPLDEEGNHLSVTPEVLGRLTMSSNDKA